MKLEFEKKSGGELLSEKCGGSDATMKHVMLAVKEEICFVVIVALLHSIYSARMSIKFCSYDLKFVFSYCSLEASIVLIQIMCILKAIFETE